MQTIIRYLTTFTVFCWLSAIALPVLAAPQIMTAPEAQAAVKAGEMILLDIRSIEEWKEDGVAEGAFPVSLTEGTFGEQLSKILEQRGDKLLGMICATGGRTEYVLSVLDKNAVSGIVDVSEGMHGNHRGPGWIKRKLPMVTAEQAKAAYEAAIQ